jgi:hypothetical protein
LKQVVEECVDYLAYELFLCQVFEKYVLRGEMSMNIEAPIVPGRSAAGIQLGSLIEEILNEHKNSFDSGEVVKPTFPVRVTTRYCSAMVNVGVIKGKVEQIMVHDGYRGKSMGKIGLGSTIADIER